MECDVAFLAQELGVMDKQTAKNRVFFVSAKEVLQHRRNLEKDDQDKEKRGERRGEGEGRRGERGGEKVRGEERRRGKRGGRRRR